LSGEGAGIPLLNKGKGNDMSTIDERRERASAGVALAADTDGWYGDFARPRVFL
jgi:hypothetical protein